MTKEQLEELRELVANNEERGAVGLLDNAEFLINAALEMGKLREGIKNITPDPDFHAKGCDCTECAYGLYLRGLLK